MNKTYLIGRTIYDITLEFGNETTNEILKWASLKFAYNSPYRDAIFISLDEDGYVQFLSEQCPTRIDCADSDDLIVTGLNTLVPHTFNIGEPVIVGATYEKGIVTRMKTVINVNEITTIYEVFDIIDDNNCLGTFYAKDLLSPQGIMGIVYDEYTGEFKYVKDGDIEMVYHPATDTLMFSGTDLYHELEDKHQDEIEVIIRSSQVSNCSKLDAGNYHYLRLIGADSDRNIRSIISNCKGNRDKIAALNPSSPRKADF